MVFYLCKVARWGKTPRVFSLIKLPWKWALLFEIILTYREIHYGKNFQMSQTSGFIVLKIPKPVLVIFIMNNSAILERSHNLISPLIVQFFSWQLSFHMITFYIIDPLQIYSIIPSAFHPFQITLLFLLVIISGPQSPQWSILYYCSAMSCLLSPLLKVRTQVDAEKDEKVGVGGEEGGPCY